MSETPTPKPHVGGSSGERTDVTSAATSSRLGSGAATGVGGARTGSGASGSAVSHSGGGSQLTTSQGKTTIADTVVAKVAGIATREVDGVHGLGGGTARAVGALRERISGSNTNYGQGVSVEVGETQAAVDVDIVADYGVNIAALAAGIRRNVIESIQQMTGLEVTEVNVTVHDVYVPQPDDTADTEPAAPRVQ